MPCRTCGLCHTPPGRFARYIVIRAALSYHSPLPDLVAAFNITSCEATPSVSGNTLRCALSPRRSGSYRNDSRLSGNSLPNPRVKEKLAFDHAELLKAAVIRLRNKVEYTSLPAFLMPQEFTLTELLEEVPRQREGRTRPAQLFRLRHRRKPIFFARSFSPRDRND